MIVNKDKAAKWFFDTFQTHTDWVGTRVETKNEQDSIMSLFEKFWNDCTED